MLLALALSAVYAILFMEAIKIMRSSNETYKKVAQYCSSYSTDCGCKQKTSNSAGSQTRTCTNCCHFDRTGAFCDLDLYDKIVKDHGLC
jgi:hypothetical protein